MRASRLVDLLLRLQDRHGAATATELATELEVSVRTVYRDVAALQAAGVPLWTESGPGGGVRLLEGWSHGLGALAGDPTDGRAAQLSDDEAGSLLLGGLGPAATELGLGSILASAQGKLLATLPPELQRRATRVQARFLLDAPHWFHRADALDALPTVADALWQDRRLELRYRRGDGEVTRMVDPLGLVLKAGTWYLVAAVGGRPRTYRVGRIVAAERRPEATERPAGFDLAAWWRDAATAFNRDILRERVVLRLSPSAQQLLPHVTDPAAATAALDASRDAGPADDDGWRTVELAVESAEVAGQQLLGLGAGVEALAPTALRHHLAAAGRALAARNAGRGPGPPGAEGPLP